MSGKKRRPRVKPEDRIPEGERAEAGTWVRWNFGYSEGHFLYDGVNALCGRYIPVTPEPATLAVLEGSYDGEEFWRAYDRRKGSKCSQCKTRAKEWEPPTTVAEDNVIEWPSDRKGQAKVLALHQQAAWVAALLDGEVVA